MMALTVITICLILLIVSEEDGSGGHVTIVSPDKIKEARELVKRTAVK